MTTDTTWWKAPLAATLPGLPLLVGEFTLFFSDSRTGTIEVLLVLAAALLALAWLLPHRRSLRPLRLVTAATALGLALMPLAYAVLLGFAMTG